jgi:hypothetical protein
MSTTDTNTNAPTTANTKLEIAAGSKIVSKQRIKLFRYNPIAGVITDEVFEKVVNGFIATHKYAHAEIAAAQGIIVVMVQYLDESD